MAQDTGQGMRIGDWVADSATSVLASDGLLIHPDSLAHTYAYNGSGQLSTDTVSAYGNTYVKTYTYSGSQLVGESVWVKQ